MRILAIYRHYWPDSTPYARILRTLLEHLAARGHQTTVFTAQPGYNGVSHLSQPWRETLHGVDVRRVRLISGGRHARLYRALDWLCFLVRAVVYALASRPYDVIIANSHPPILMGCALRLIRAIRGIPYIYHCQDLHPESAALAGDLRRGWMYQQLLLSDTSTCRQAQHVVVLSRDMVESIERRGLSTENVSVINNPPLAISPSIQTQLPPEFAEPCTTVRFLFAGNLGRFQGLERLVAAARLVPHNMQIQLIFMGEGEAKRALVEQSSDALGRRIVFVPHQPVETAAAAMRACDYGVVSLRDGVYRYAYPSKTMMYLSAGCPLLAVIEPDSELARTVEKQRLGYVTKSRSVLDIAESFTRAVEERNQWTPECRKVIALASQQLFGEQQMLSAWDELIEPAPHTLQQAA
jgi:glycosyltransferase involved in cell wall biosynthesis